MHSQRLEELFLRYSEQTLSEVEREELMNLLLLEENREQVNALIDRLVRSEQPVTRLSGETADEILHSIFTATTKHTEAATDDSDEEEYTHPKRSIWIFRIAAASLALILLYGGYKWLNAKKETISAAPVLASIYGGDAPAGGNRATLTLANGQHVDLATITSGSLIEQPGTVIDKTKGEVIYQDIADQAIAYNVLTTPLGGQYKVVLPDGSRAWLNAGSKLTYPTAFSGDVRHVKMSGEVYFEIEPNKKQPFRVQVCDKAVNGKDMEITVLGTHFNVCSYGDEPTMQTTLLEGSVRVVKDHMIKILSPGQQARVANGQAKEIAVKTVDAESVVAWKEGRFEFNGNIKEIMRQISRWYDLDVHYEGNVGEKSFAGTISRKNNVSEVLKMLELTGGIQFRIDNRKVTVRNTE